MTGNKPTFDNFIPWYENLYLATLSKSTPLGHFSDQPCNRRPTLSPPDRTNAPSSLHPSIQTLPFPYSLLFLDPGSNFSYRQSFSKRGGRNPAGSLREKEEERSLAGWLLFLLSSSPPRFFFALVSVFNLSLVRHASALHTAWLGEREGGNSAGGKSPPFPQGKKGGRRVGIKVWICNKMV